ncbi:ribbon-helix-helix domain-containing protein [Picrophilus oshimae]|uniref:Transcriptional regulator, CopG family n=1 Tax=Picrophilus torridus (strain ATCC 700027 / DSM 9790 / JCM 10055 / NBRC 100828 / KAW 2/3) TaxID=1122961 RepID=A0A8G2FXD8_PICTO|nr:ribbon-helix-helix domain-containing protein [Picrophilus oshimae]SMD31181.1 hypothetical protein SAMN02745355_1104 [Picrophilus oshimae DSM 9789]
MVEKTTKITLRISEEELNEIDDFLERNPQYGSRSEFLRHSALNFINSQRVFLVNDDNAIHIAKRFENFFKMAVDNGYFTSIESAVNEVIENAMREELLLKMINAKKGGLKSLEKALKDDMEVDREYDKYKF